MKGRFFMGSRVFVTLLVVLALLVGCGPSRDSSGSIGTGGPTEVGAGVTATNTPIIIATANWNVVANGNYNASSYLRWDHAGALYGGTDLSVTYKYKKLINADSATQVADPWNGYPGQCVSFIKSASGRTSGTSTWRPGIQAAPANFCPNLALGTAVATFPGGSYSGHCGFYGGPSGSGFAIYDENWSLDGTVKRHVLSRTGTGSVSDAGTYYVILAP